MIECPMCHSDVYIQKASAVYSAGTGSYSGPSTTVVNAGGKWGTGVTFTSGQTTTQLATKVAPPREPLKPGQPAQFWLGLVLAIIFVLPICYIMALGRDNSGWCLPATILVVLVGIINMVLGSQVRSKKLAEFQIDHEEWSSTLAQWQRMYYCHKHDIMFDPESGDVYSFTQSHS